jgi:hypothetical protein
VHNRQTSNTTAPDPREELLAEVDDQLVRRWLERLLNEDEANAGEKGGDR